MATAYYGVKISPNVVTTDEGYLIFKNAIIARTGFQRYKGSELPESEIESAGITVNADDDVDVYRSPEEVFSKSTIASFNGKAVTDNHPPDLLDIETHADYQCGHMMNVRKGPEPLENGDWPLLADIQVTDKNLIMKYQSGIRELSCGYTYHLLKDGDKLLQVDICGNHVAVVPNGRAGPLVKIQDAAPEKKEKFTMSQLAKKIRVLGLKALFQDDKLNDEQLSVALDSMYARDEEPEEKKEEEKPKADDAKAKDRKRQHDALDKLMDANDAKAAEDAAASDADMEELRGILSGGAGAEKSKTTEGLDEECEEEGMDEDPEEVEAEDSVGDHEESTVISPEDRSDNPLPAAVDAAFVAGQKSVLKALKPHVAVSKDARFKKAFDTASKVVVGKAVGSKGTYASFAKLSAKANDSVSEDPYAKENKLAKEVSKYYADRHGKMIKQ